jgi:DNA-directed RNA polymerase specialized sigma subunit
MFEILKNLPVPQKYVATKKGLRVSKYPFEEMEIGDCLAFSAQSIKDTEYKKIYGYAMSFARRVKKGYTFRFGKIEEGKFGCWKIEQSDKVESRKYKKRTSTNNITKEMLIEAFENEGTLTGISRALNISSRTVSRLKIKYQMV